ncbi:MAG: phage minor head protein, partial [Muribaculaceae bacterium]
MVVERLYYGQQPQETLAAQNFHFDQEVLERALRNIYRSEFRPMTDIERNLFHEFCKIFNRATEQGVRKTKHPDEEFVSALRHNNAVFAAFKTHRLQNDVARQLLDDNGVLKPFEQWKNDVRSITSHQCNRWLQTEYDTAVLRARQAANWQQFIEEEDVLPNLKWMPSTSPNPGADHRPFWNTVLPIRHPFWTQHRPGDRWNCKCDLRSTDETPTAVPAGSSDGDNPQPGLDNN